MNALLALAIAMAVGLLSTRLMKYIGLPDVTGYLLSGLLIGPYILNWVTEENIGTLNIVTTVALGFIAFSIGSSFKLSSLKQIGKSVVIITFFQALTAVAFVDGVLILIGTPLPMALTLGAIATATAPAATLMVVRQYKAKGIVTDTLLPVVAFDDAIGLMVFSISIAIAQVLVLGGTLTVKSMLLEPLLEIFLSITIGAALGFVAAFGSRLFRSRANRISLIIAVVFGGLALSIILKLSNLLVCMMIGAIYSNFFKESQTPLETLDMWTYPLYMLFFVISGADLNISVIPAVGITGIVYIVVRALGKYTGALLGGLTVKADKKVTKYLGLTLFPQAGVAIGMAQMVITDLPEYGKEISTIVLCATLVYELIGPVITKIALSKAGEIDLSQQHSIFKKRVHATETAAPSPVSVEAPTTVETRITTVESEANSQVEIKKDK